MTDITFTPTSAAGPGQATDPPTGWERIFRLDFSAAETNQNNDIWNVGDWYRNGDSILRIVRDPDRQDTNRVLSVGRTNPWDGISGNAGLFADGNTYAFSLWARLAEGGPEHADVRFELTNGPLYEWVGNTEVTNDKWTRVVGTCTFTGDAAGFRAYIASSNITGFARFTILIDDIEIYRAIS